MTNRLLFIRHCRSTGQAPDAPLAADGKADADRLAYRLLALGVDAAYASPFRRAIETVAPFAALRGLDVTLEERLVERRLEKEPSPAWLDHVRLSFDDDTYRAHGGETLAEARARGLAALTAIDARGHDRPAIVTHGNLLSSILRAIDASWGFEQWRGLGNPDLFAVRVERGQPVAFERLPWR